MHALIQAGGRVQMQGAFQFLLRRPVDIVIRRYGDDYVAIAFARGPLEFQIQHQAGAVADQRRGADFIQLQAAQRTGDQRAFERDMTFAREKIQQRLAGQFFCAGAAELFQPGRVYLDDDALADHGDRIRRAVQRGSKLLFVIPDGLAGFVQRLFEAVRAQLAGENRDQPAWEIQGNHVLGADSHRGGDRVLVDRLGANDDRNARGEAVPDPDDLLQEFIDFILENDDQFRVDLVEAVAEFIDV